jgi:hypothetical protein
MTAPKLTVKELKIRGLLVEGHSRKSVAKIMRTSYSAIRVVADRLEFLGYIRRDPRTISPIMYYDPQLASAPSAQPQIGGYDGGNQGMMDPEPVHDPTLSRVHLAGSYLCDVLFEGTTDPIRDRAGRVYGHWRADTVAPKGRTDRYADLTVEDQKVTICLRRGKSSLTLAIWPGETWLSGADAYDRGAKQLTDRVNLVCALMRLNNWRLGPPVLRGVVHAAHVDSPLIALADRNKINDNAPIQADTSGGNCEIEAFNNSDNNVLAFLPDHIRGLYARAKGIEDLLASLVRIQEYQAQLTATGMPILSGASDLGGMYQ